MKEEEDDSRAIQPDTQLHGGRQDFAASYSMTERRARLSEGERHSIGHAQYQVDRATPDKPDVCFDYELVACLLRLIKRLRARGERERQEG